MFVALEAAIDKVRAERIAENVRNFPSVAAVLLIMPEPGKDVCGKSAVVANRDA
jgi:hypothetical protein